MRLLLVAGERGASLMDAKMRKLPCKAIQADELWCFVMKRRGKRQDADPADYGDQWIFVAEDPDTKLVPSFVVGKRTASNTAAFMRDLQSRLTDRIQLTTDGFHFYLTAVEKTFGADVDFATLTKLYHDTGSRDTSARYSPGTITEVISKVRQGHPDPKYISTSYVERQNLNIRMALRRFTRLTNAFSKKLSHLKAAVALYFAFYNFCRVHSTLRVTPAMEAGLTDHVWDIGELLHIPGI
jgi:IS1 family transposase